MNVRMRLAMYAAALGAAAGSGCNVVPVLPDELDVAISAAERLPAARGSGPAALADSTWGLVREADADGGEDPSANAPPGPYGGLLTGMGLARPAVGERLFLATFGDMGQMVLVTENRFLLPEIYGMEVPVGGEWSGAALPGVLFHSASYGVQQGDRIGLAVVVDVRFLEIYLGRATLYAWGTVNENALTGTFGYVIDFTEGAVPFLGTMADQYPVTGMRVAG